MQRARERQGPPDLIGLDLGEILGGGPERGVGDVGADGEREVELRQEAVVVDRDVDAGRRVLLGELRELRARVVRALDQRGEIERGVARAEVGRHAKAEIAGAHLHADGAAQHQRRVEHRELAGEHLLLGRRDRLLDRRDLRLRAASGRHFDLRDAQPLFRDREARLGDRDLLLGELEIPVVRHHGLYRLHGGVPASEHHAASRVSVALRSDAL